MTGDHSPLDATSPLLRCWDYKTMLQCLWLYLFFSSFHPGNLHYHSHACKAGTSLTKLPPAPQAPMERSSYHNYRQQSWWESLLSPAVVTAYIKSGRCLVNLVELQELHETCKFYLLPGSQKPCSRRCFCEEEATTESTVSQIKKTTVPAKPVGTGLSFQLFGG